MHKVLIWAARPLSRVDNGQPAGLDFENSSLKMQSAEPASLRWVSVCAALFSLSRSCTYSRSAWNIAYGASDITHSPLIHPSARAPKYSRRHGQRHLQWRRIIRLGLRHSRSCRRQHARSGPGCLIKNLLQADARRDYNLIKTCWPEICAPEGLPTGGFMRTRSRSAAGRNWPPFFAAAARCKSPEESGIWGSVRRSVGRLPLPPMLSTRFSQKFDADASHPVTSRKWDEHFHLATARTWWLKLGCWIFTFATDHTSMQWIFADFEAEHKF